MIPNGAAEVMEKLEKDISEATIDPKDEAPEIVENDAQTDELAADADSAEDKDEDTAEEPTDEEVDPLEAAALSDDERKRAKAFASHRVDAREAKERAEKAEQRANDLAERLARLEGAASVTAKPEAAQTSDDEPDRLMYPEDWATWDRRQLQKQVDELKSVVKQTQSVTTYQSEIRGMEALDGQYKVANPKDDLDGAKAFLVSQERENMKILRPKAKDAEIEAQIESDKLTLYRVLHQQGRNPAEVIMALAKKAGYTGGGVKEAPKRDLGKLAENQRKASNLIGGSPAGKGVGGKISSDDLFNMSMDKLVRMSKKDKNLFEGADE